MLFEELKKEKLIAIVRGVLPEQLEDLASALSAGGIRFMEIAFDRRFPEKDRQILKSITNIRTAFPGKIHLGVGTVLDAQQVGAAAEAGAEYIVSPNFSRSVIAETKRLGLLSVPGAFTPSEAAEAYESGADFVKIFPASVLGAEYFRAISAPLAHIPLLAFGGITAENLPDFLKAGASGAGIGKQLIDPDSILAERFDKITETARNFVKMTD